MDPVLWCKHCDEAIRPEDVRSRTLTTQTHWECTVRLVVGAVAHQAGRCACVDPRSPEGDDPALSRHVAAWAAVEYYLQRGEGDAHDDA